jgi:cytidylate kinase
MAVVTLSRQYGSGADDVAAHVCDTLGYRFFDKSMMAQMASEFGLTPENIIDFSEESYEVRSFLDRFRGPRVVAQYRVWREDLTGRRIAEMEQLDEKLAITIAQRTIRSAYENDNIVILGRGGQAILRDQPGVLHVRIEAPLDARVQRIQEQEGVSQQAAQKTVNTRDRAAADYLSRFYDIDWADSTLYHLVINTGRWDAGAAAHLIVNAVSHLPPVEASAS